MPEGSAKQPASKNSLPPAIKIVLIVAAILFVLGIVGTIAAGFVAGSFFSGIFGQNKVQVNQNGTVEVKTDDGKVSFSNKKELPGNWPSDVPVYPGATVLASFAGENHLVNVQFWSQDDLEKVIQYYKDQLPGNGWQADSEQGYFPLGGGIGLAVKDDRRLSVTIIGNNNPKEGEGKTSITIAVVKTTPSPAAQ
ncbi:hypothetical protein IT415_01670 [bacterium]|nr:hypothetical protein [bacterium]